MKYNLIFCYILVAAAAVSATDYCNMNCTANGREIKHIACGNNGEFGPLCPKNVQLLNITESLKNIFLHEINVQRNLFANGTNSTYQAACRMATVQWDDELAKHAALNVKLCKDWADYCHTTDSIRSSGQGLNSGLALPNDTLEGIIPATIALWLTNLSEVKPIDLLTDGGNRVGCAITSSLLIGKAHFRNMWLTCNFATDVHYGDSMYEMCKTPGEKCKNKPIAPYPNLCGVDEIYEI